MNNLNKNISNDDYSNIATIGRSAPTIIDANTKIEGTMTSKSEVIINGVIIGDIKSNTVTVGRQALVTGSIEAKNSIISGQFDGDIVAERVELKATAKVSGGIRQKTIIVDSGAQLEVNIQILS